MKEHFRAPIAKDARRLASEMPLQIGRFAG